MAVKLNRANIPDLHMPPVDPNTAVIDYDAATDTLFFRRAVAPAASLNIDGELWLRVNPDSGEVYGFEVEAFANDFIKRHRDILRIWKRLPDRSNLRLAEPEARHLVDAMWRLLRDRRVPELRVTTPE